MLAVLLFIAAGEKRSVPPLLTSGALPETLHAPHVLTGPTLHITFDAGTQCRYRLLVIITVYRVRSTLYNHLETATVRQAHTMQKHTVGHAALEQTRHKFAGQRLYTHERHKQTALQ